MLAIWEFFWDPWPAGEPEPPPSTATAVAVVGLGSKKSKEIDWVVDPALEPRTPEDFWMIREKYLERLRADSEEVVPHEIILEAVGQLDQGIPAVQAIAEVVAQRERAYRAAEAARTTAELNAEATKIITLTQKIAKLKMQKDEDDAILMLLMVL